MDALRAASVELFDAVRQECTSTTWSRGVNISRGGQLSASAAGADAIALRVTTPGGASTPRVTLTPGRASWDCECPSDSTPCAHVAAVAILLRHGQGAGPADAGPEPSGPRLEYALSRGPGGLALEVRLRRGDQVERVTDNVLALRKRLRPERLELTRVDLRIAELMRVRRVGPILRPVAAGLLAALREVDDLRLDGAPVRVGEPGHAVSVVVTNAGKGRFRVASRALVGVDEVFDNGLARRGDEVFAVLAPDLSDNDLAALARGKVYGADDVHALVTRVLPELRDRVPVDVKTRRLPSVVPLPAGVMFEVERDGDSVAVTPWLAYGDPPSARLEGGRVVRLGGDLPMRDAAAERALSARLRTALHMQPGVGRRVRGQEAVALATQVRRFGGAIVGDGLDACFVAGPLAPDLVIEGDAARLSFVAEREGARVSASADAVLSAWQAGSPFVALDAGGWAPLPEGFLDRHGHLVADLLAASEGRPELPRSVGADVARLAEALDRPVPADFARLRQLAEGFDGLPPARLPSDLRGELRGYQRRGVDWLAFLSRAGLGALLADDMGLGKTLQALCALGAPALVVCPSSVLHAWRAEIARFRPGLTVGVYHAAGRALDDADVTLTTYALLRRDRDVLSAREWDTVVLDEAQTIKNPTSQVALAAYELPARFRVALTGTPIENRLEDLWSQMRFLNPGLLGGLTDFRERYERPVAEGDRDRGEHLRRRVRPFVLRREKRQVAAELPPRTVVVLRCTLDEEERAAYDAVRAATRDDVVRELAAGRSVLAALEALLRLRQAACHTGLLPGRRAPSSSKIRLLLETLEEVLAEGHRALIFSQWTSLLDLVEPHLGAAGVAFCRLDGSTRDREAVVTSFQSEDGPPVMLVSLKAGGVGLTLTAADHVFLLDPWWNPAVEDQAADRTHRIGQQHPVLVHRLVAEDTVEERLIDLQERKRALSRAVLDGVGGADASGGLTRADLLALLD